MSRDEFARVTGETLRRMRVDAGMKQLEVAEALGVAEATVSRWEAGSVKNISAFTVQRLEALYRRHAAGGR